MCWFERCDIFFTNINYDTVALCSPVNILKSCKYVGYVYKVFDNWTFVVKISMVKLLIFKVAYELFVRKDALDFLLYDAIDPQQ